MRNAGFKAVAGQAVLDLQGEALRQARGGLIGYVAQDPATALNPALRIGALLRETVLAHHPGLARSVVRQRVGQPCSTLACPMTRRLCSVSRTSCLVGSSNG